MEGDEVIVTLASIPVIGWIVLLILGVLVIVLVFFILKTKNIKTKYFECNSQKRELFMAEGKDQLDNQTHVAKQLLKQIRIKLFLEGKEFFNITDKKDLIIWELSTYRVAERLNYDMKNDLTRNHITKKSDSELFAYSDSKAEAYMAQITDRLYMLNAFLPEYDLPKI